ncbi:methyltransferase [Kalaharituber pfeilii]|nr:methyltransferase [Kalaharituber pfeilii]
MAITTSAETVKPIPPTIPIDLHHSILPADDSKPYIRLSQGSEYEHNFAEEAHPVSVNINDARNVLNWVNEFHMDKTGFQFVLDDKPSRDLLNAISHRDDERIQKEYYPMVEELLLREVEGAKKVVIFDHTVRTTLGGPQEDKEAPQGPQNRKPVRKAHVDQTTPAAIQRVHKHCPEQAEKLKKGRFRIVNVWRPLRGPVRDVPLAFCDYRTVNHASDLHATDLIYPGHTGEIFTVTHNPEHQWYFLRDQMPNEVALIKCFDNKEGVAKLTPHSAFDLPNPPEGTLPRHSIEVRTLVFDINPDQE